MSCTCHDQCPPEAQCACIHVLGSGECHCDCYIELVTLSADPPEKLALDEEIDLNVRSANLGAVALWLDHRTQVDLLVPAAAVRDKVTVSTKQVTLGEALADIGLITGGASSRARA